MTGHSEELADADSPTRIEGVAVTLRRRLIVVRSGCSRLGANRALPRLLHALAVSRGDGSYARFLARLAKIDLLALDDWLLAPLTDAERRDVLEVIEDRIEHRSTLVAAALDEGAFEELGDTAILEASRRWGPPRRCTDARLSDTPAARATMRTNTDENGDSSCHMGARAAIAAAASRSADCP